MTTIVNDTVLCIGKAVGEQILNAPIQGTTVRREGKGAPSSHGGNDFALCACIKPHAVHLMRTQYHTSVTSPWDRTGKR